MWRWLLLCGLLSACGGDCAEPAKPRMAAEATCTEEERRQFQSQDLLTARPYNWIVMPGQSPRIIWRDADTVRSMGFNGPLRVRWFDAQLREAPHPDAGGRWLAWIESVAPNGTPLRRGLTFYAIPKTFTFHGAPEFRIALPSPPDTLSPLVWREHENELSRTANDQLLRLLLDSPSSAIMVAALSEWKPLGRPARVVDSAAVLHEDYHLSLKLKVQGLQKNVRAIKPPRPLRSPAAILHAGSLNAAGMRADGREKIAAVCRAWAADSGEPMVTLVARRGVIVLHEAFGKDSDGNSVTLAYRCDVASITKTVTGLLLSRFLDQGLLALDDSVGKFFPDYPPADPHVPTFRQCLNHTSGLSGHGDFGGCRNPHFENVVLNGLDVNRPGVKYSYSGQGFELAVKALEIISGRSAVRLYDEYLFRPLGFTDVPIDGASAGGRFTAFELGVLAQCIANRGSYGDLELISPTTFAKLMPERLTVPDRGGVEDEGIGLHWVRHLKPGAPPNSKAPADLLFSPGTIGHGSFSGCVFVVDPQQQLIITQVRRQSGPRSDQWSARFFQTIAAAINIDATNHQTPAHRQTGILKLGGD